MTEVTMTFSWEELEYLADWLSHEADVAHERLEEDDLKPLYEVAELFMEQYKAAEDDGCRTTITMTRAGFDRVVEVVVWRDSLNLEDYQPEQEDEIALLPGLLEKIQEQLDLLSPLEVA